MLKVSGLAVVALISVTGIAEANPHKKITNGVGNCIFSAGEMPKDKFGTWKVASKFKAGDAVYMRCFFPKALKDFAKDGKMKNSMRAPIEESISAQGSEYPTYYASITWQDDKSKWWHMANQSYVESETGTWTEVRFDQPYGDAATKDTCSFKLAKFNKPEDCVSLETESKNLASMLKKTGTYNAEVCLDVYAYKVDKKKTVNLKTVDDIQNLPMARGCFTYSVSN